MRCLQVGLLLLACGLLVPAHCHQGSGAKGVVRARSAGTTLQQGLDGSWIQIVNLHGVALPGWDGLRSALTKQVVAVTCPSSEVRRGTRLRGR
jgi:hypothetical protein